MNQGKDEAIQCCHCKRVFAAEIGPTQAYGCASDVQEDREAGKRRVFSHYGSRFDSECHELEATSTLPNGLVCDDCLSNEIAQGHASKTPVSLQLMSDEDRAILKAALPDLFKE